MGKNLFHSLSAKFTQLFLDGQADQTSLQPETKEDTYQFISAGGFHTAAITKDGSLYTWGNNEYGQLGDGSQIDKNLPVRMLKNVAAVSAGGFHTAAITKDGSLYTWGCNEFGQLGDGTNVNRLSPVRIMINVFAVSAGFKHTMAITNDGTLYTWGCNQKNQIGPPTIILNLPSTKNMSEEQKEAIRNALYRNGTVARNEPENWPKQPFNECAAAVSAGNFHSTKLTSDGNAFAWGSDQYHQLGTKKSGSYGDPQFIMGGVTKIEAGGFHTAAITKDGSLYTWGNNQCGQLGRQTNEKRKMKPVKMMNNVIAVSAGSNHTAAITKDGSLYTWGNNLFGQLGDGTRVGRVEPKKILNHVTAVSAGARHTAAITKDGSLYTWGNNEYGQLGDGTNNAATLPCQIIRACETEVLNEIRKKDQYILNLATKNNTDTPKYCTIYVVIQRSDDSLKSCEVAYAELPANGRIRTEIKFPFPFEPGDIYKIATEYRNA